MTSSTEWPVAYKQTHMSSTKLRYFKECQRKFYWYFVRLLATKSTSIPLTLGSLFHEGMAVLFKTKNLDEALAVIDTQFSAIRNNFFVSPEDEQYMSYIDIIIKSMLRGYYEQNRTFLPDIEVVAAEQRFSINMEKQKWAYPSVELDTVPYAGTIDLLFRHGNKLYVGEHKTKSQITPNILKYLIFDFQVNMYPVGAHSLFGEWPASTYYNIIRKPGIRLKQNETIQQYYARCEREYIERPDYYFHEEWVPLNKLQIDRAIQDVYIYMQQILDKYINYGADVIDSAFWPRNDDACENWGGCPYFFLCRDGELPHLLNNFKIKECRYPEEEAELIP